MGLLFDDAPAFLPATPDTTDYDIEGAQEGAETESDDEEVLNTVGNIPMEWYNDFPHIGYNLDGEKVMRPAKGDELDQFLEKMDNPDFWCVAPLLFPSPLLAWAMYEELFPYHC